MAVETKKTQEKPETDRIEKSVMLRAARSRVWRAITTAKEFEEWFRVRLDGGFAEGVRVQGRITSSGYEHVTLDMLIVRIDPEKYFSYRWHPNPTDPGIDYSADPTTLVEFHLEETADGTLLKIVESGFDRLPPARRAEAFRMNDRGWDGEIRNLTQYVS